jgi:hypothetical protein
MNQSCGMWWSACGKAIELTGEFILCPITQGGYYHIVPSGTSVWLAPLAYVMPIHVVAETKRAGKVRRGAFLFSRPCWL